MSEQEAQLIAVEKQGRHRYYRLASPDIAHAILALMAIAASGPKRHHPICPKDEALWLARTCYDHIAGRLAIAPADTLSAILALISKKRLAPNVR